MGNEHHYGIGGKANLPGAFFEAARQNPDQPLFTAKIDGVWTGMTRSDAALYAGKLVSALYQAGIRPGDRVMIAAENSPEWAIADLAIMAAGAIVVPAYTTNTADDHRYIMDHSGAVMAITTTGQLADRVLEAAGQCEAMATVMVIGDRPEVEPGGVTLMTWADAMGSSSDDLDPADLDPDDLDPAELEAAISAINPDDTCCFIYTSGTGGRPKGVMLSHASIQANIDAAADLLKEGRVNRGQRFLSLLPLSHAYEHTAGLHLPIQTASEIWYCEGADQIASNLAEASPTLMTAVPRLYEVLYDRITRGVRQKGGISEKLFNRAVAIGRRRISGGLTLSDRLIDPVLDLLVRRKVRARLGGNLEYFVSGGAALNPDIGTFFLALGVNILQGYGQTEASPLISANRPGLIKIESVGPAVSGVEVRLSDAGEILARGPMLMKGYWQDDAATAATIRDGWLYTGDLGSIDADGYITITGRAKEIIVNSGGDNIAPGRLEGIIALEPEIDQVMVDGDRKPWLAAVVVPSQSVLDQSGTPHDRQSEAVRKAVSAAIDRANASLSTIERVRRFILADESFSTENGQMTATLKTRRHVVREVYGDRLEQLYRGKSG